MTEYWSLTRIDALRDTSHILWVAFAGTTGVYKWRLLV
jgi:hypothetical protein